MVISWQSTSNTSNNYSSSPVSLVFTKEYPSLSRILHSYSTRISIYLSKFESPNPLIGIYILSSSHPPVIR